VACLFFQHSQHHEPQIAMTEKPAEPTPATFMTFAVMTHPTAPAVTAVTHAVSKKVVFVHTNLDSFRYV